MPTQRIEDPTHNGLVTAATIAASRHEESTTPESRKAKGQFFTPGVVADFMASMFATIPKDCRLLDAGAGVGTLTAAVCERVSGLRSPRSLHADLYETDTESLPHLRAVLANCEQHLQTAGHTFSFRVIEKDFALDEDNSLPLFEQQGDLEPYHLAIMNPPYFKIRANSDYAQAAQALGSPHPNIYSLFMASAVSRLHRRGELVAITPRSFCNGLYFREFRNWLFKRTTLKQVHAFASRTDTFKEAKVLQESIITRFRQSAKPSASVLVTRSYGRDFQQVDTQEIGHDRVVDASCGDSLICIPETPEDAEILDIAEHWTERFSDSGLKISTGPVVMFRTKEFHVDKLNGKRTVPLLSAHHVKRTGLCWPNPKQKWPDAFATGKDASKHLVPRDNYVLLKRFSAKEERRRLTASALLSTSFEHGEIALENHINYITHTTRSLSQDEAVGLEAMFNSAFMDRYFRTFSGNTQVNATEVRTMKFPNLSVVADIGKTIRSNGITPSSDKEMVVLDALKISGKTRTYLKGFFF